MSWTDTRVELLTKLWADGLSASQIATELGGWPASSPDGGRNAVIGKVHRMGLSGRAKEPGNSNFRAKPRKARPKGTGMTRADRLMRGNTALAYDYAVEESEAELIEIPLDQRKTLLQLTEKTCHWPIGDPGSGAFYFCGGEAPGAHDPYCAYHSRAAHQSPSDRRRDYRPRV